MKHDIIPIFIPHYGCRHACIFCNQRKITGLAQPVKPQDVAEMIAVRLAEVTLPRKVEVAFYGGSFTALPLAEQIALLQPAYEALQQGRIQAIRLSTRPDAINRDVVETLLHFGVGTVELGVQSLDDDVLAAAKRGHNADDVFRAVSMLKKAGILCGLQLMPGLPGEDWSSLVWTAAGILDLQPDMMRIYPAVVITGTHMAELYRVGLYSPLTMDEAVKRAAFLKLLCEQNGIRVIRIGLQATEELSNQAVVLAGPYHPSFGEIVESYLFHLMLAAYFESVSSGVDELTVHHHPRDHSKLRGLGGANLKTWRKKYGLKEIKLIADGDKTGELTIDAHDGRYKINKKMLLRI